MYELISDDEDWLFIDFEMEWEFLIFINWEYMDVIVDRILECESLEFIIDDNEVEEEDNVVEDDEFENFIDFVIILLILRIVMEIVIFKMIKRIIIYNDGVIEIVWEIDILYLEMILVEEVDVFKFVIDVLSEIFEYFKNWDVKIVILNN